jgi:NADH-quinone oxidoreductase subunit N
MTMIWGNLGALGQKGMKRLLAYSSIAHTGYLLLGVLAVVKNTVHVWEVEIYLLLYGISFLGAFAVLQLLANDKDVKDISLADLSGVGMNHPLLAGSLSVFLLGMAGIPITSGFIGKYLIFFSATEEGLVGLVVLAVITSLISVYYYLRVIVTMFMRAGAVYQRQALPLGAVLVVSGAVAVALWVGIFPNQILRIFQAMTVKLI